MPTPFTGRMDRLICRVILKRFPTTTILMAALAALLLSAAVFAQEGPHGEFIHLSYFLIPLDFLLENGHPSSF